MWWAIETVTTVGYGDIIPDQTAGKVIAGFLMLGGLSLISVLTAVITSGFVALAQERRRAAGEDPIGQKLEEIATEVRALGRPTRSSCAARGARDPGLGRAGLMPVDSGGGRSQDGRCWARTSDLRLVEAALSQLS